MSNEDFKRVFSYYDTVSLERSHDFKFTKLPLLIDLVIIFKGKNKYRF